MFERQEPTDAIPRSARLSRRRLLLAGGAGAVAAMSSLAGCSSGSGDAEGAGEGGEPPTGGAGTSLSPGGGASTSSGGLALPADVPFTKFTFDLPGTEEGVSPAVLNFPAEKDWIKLDIDGAANGASITSLGPAPGGSQPPEIDKNAYMQMIWKRLGGELHIKYTTNYAATYATTIAGNDIPDTVRILVQAGMLGLLDAKFADLTEYLQGDGVKEYPNLANRNQDAWKIAIYNGKIVGIPRPVPFSGKVMVWRTDKTPVDMTPDDITDGPTFLKLCKELTNVKENRWAANHPIPLVSWIEQCMGGVNQWARQDGKFVSHNTTEQAKQALDAVAQIWKSGYIYPDAFSKPKGLYLMTGGQVALDCAGLINYWIAIIRDAVADGAHIDTVAIKPPKWEGGGMATQFLSPPASTFTALKKAAPDRIRTILKVLDWISAPFGTDIYVAASYGVKDKDFTINPSGGLVATSEGFNEVVSSDIHSLAAPPYVAYQPGLEPTDVQRIHDFETSVVPNSVQDASLGLVSKTKLATGSVIDKKLSDLQTDVITGRKKLADWDDAVRSWRQNGGDKIAAEYEQAYEAANK